MKTRQPAQSGSLHSACSAWRKRCQAAESKVLEQVRLCGGFSVFWAAENMDRARAIERLHRKKGMIEPKKGKAYGRFPWCGYRIVKPNTEASRDEGGAKL